MWWFISISNWLLVGLFVGFIFSTVSLGVLYSVNVGGFGYIVGDCILLDSCGFILGLLTLMIWLVLWVMGVSNFFISLSVFSALLSYVSVNSLVFWFFYELSIISALLLLVKDSPYPERYCASWYFGGYIILSGVPLLLCILIVSFFEGTVSFLGWNISNYNMVFWLMCLMFMTKVPVPPFHVWLPLVHAEASSPVSIILSGYIMKLGVLGVIRFGGGVFNSDLLLGVVVWLCIFGLLFVLSSYIECDAKRWLAMLSLFHILVAVLLLSFGTGDYDLVSLLYCFGHGVAAASAFLAIWWGYSYIGSRDWYMLSCVLGGVLGVQLLIGLMFLCVAGFPPTLQFISELLVVVSLSGVSDYVMLFVVSFFLFGGSLLVFVIFGMVLVSSGVFGSICYLGLDKCLMGVLFMSVFGVLSGFLL
uniref:NADH-ubiquinone oxidoreductase chain 4 n=1 Tax=Trichobilharzia regenti TaxID=157069 RepID=A7J1K9_TRIRE|nr:NADH dehydrogenase subunit 4 [Trichobilharzia regenti]ABG91498.1 NADH dehydrogenase subunit 4 [Trichobilharzia regenti]BAV82969.1 NADH dehydrogenase subunit 4 [Trichobilharzia regenti]